MKQQKSKTEEMQGISESAESSIPQIFEIHKNTGVFL